MGDVEGDNSPFLLPINPSLAIIGITLRRGVTKTAESRGLKVYFIHELTSCRRKSEFRHSYPKLEQKLMRKPPSLLGEIVQRGVRA